MLVQLVISQQLILFLLRIKTKNTVAFVFVCEECRPIFAAKVWLVVEEKMKRYCSSMRDESWNNFREDTWDIGEFTYILPLLNEDKNSGGTMFEYYILGYVENVEDLPGKYVVITVVDTKTNQHYAQKTLAHSKEYRIDFRSKEEVDMVDIIVENGNHYYHKVTMIAPLRFVEEAPKLPNLYQQKEKITKDFIRSLHHHIAVTGGDISKFDIEHMTVTKLCHSIIPNGLIPSFINTNMPENHQVVLPFFIIPDKEEDE